MTKANALSPLPYGASELKQVARPYLLRGVVVASAAWIAAFLLLELLVPQWASVAIPRIDPTRFTCIGPPPPPAFVAQARSASTSLPRATAKRGQIEPVPDDVAPAQVIVPPSDARFSGTEGVGESGEAAVIGGSTSAQAPPDDDALPKRGDLRLVDERPILAHDVLVTYPDLAREAGVEGRVVVHYLIGKDGRVIDAEIDPEHSIVLLDQCVLDAVRQLRFIPAFAHARPVPVWESRTYDFKLHGVSAE